MTPRVETLLRQAERESFHTNAVEQLAQSLEHLNKLKSREQNAAKGAALASQSQLRADAARMRRLIYEYRDYVRAVVLSEDEPWRTLTVLQIRRDLENNEALLRLLAAEQRPVPGRSPNGRGVSLAALGMGAIVVTEAFAKKYLGRVPRLDELYSDEEAKRRKRFVWLNLRLGAPMPTLLEGRDLEAVIEKIWRDSPGGVCVPR